MPVAKSTVPLMQIQLMSPPAVPTQKNASVSLEFHFHCLNFKNGQPVVISA